MIAHHDGEGQFLTFTKGSLVNMNPGADDHFLHWHACDIEGIQTFISASFVIDGVLQRDYNPTELICTEGDRVDVLEVVNAWLFARDKKGNTGWIPAESVVSDNPAYCPSS